MGAVKDWADERVDEAIRAVARKFRNSDLRADDKDVRAAVASAMRKIVGQCRNIVEETETEFTDRVWSRDEDAQATLRSASQRIKDKFRPGKEWTDGSAEHV